MRNLLLFAASIFVIAGAASCKKGGETTVTLPNIQFETSSYTLDDEAIQLKVISSVAATADLTVDFTLGGNAAAADYELSANSFVIKKGETEATVTMTPLKAYEQSATLTLTLKSGSGYDVGRVGATTVKLEVIKYVYSFSVATVDLLESVEVTLTLNSQVPMEVEVPFKILSESTSIAGQHYVIKDNVTKFVVPKNSNKATITINSGTEADMENPTVLKISVDTDATGDRFEGGENPSITITVKGILSFGALAGKWEYVEMLGYDNLELWVEDEGADIGEIPSHNDGFTIEFKNVDGANMFIPSGGGDLSNLFKECSMSYTAPINCATGQDSAILSDYTSREYSFWNSELFVVTYFELSDAYRSFDGDAGNSGTIPIALAIKADGNLVLMLRGYDEPPFLEEFWLGEFDGDYNGFCYLFKKVE